jgi:hypothetical protein
MSPALVRRRTGRAGARKEGVMRAIGGRAAAVGAWVLGGGPAWAATESGAAGFGLWTVVFLGFGALVVVFQAVPAVLLLGSLLRSLFGRSAVGAEVAGERRKGG